MKRQQQNHLHLMFRIILFLQISLMPVDAFCAQVILGWNEITGSNIAGYRIFCREENGTYNFNRPLWTGTGTRIVIKDLVDNRGYYFIVRTYTTTGIESLNSNEVFYKTPQIQPPSEVNILTPTNYAVADLDVGDTYYLDRTFTLTSIPTGLSTGTEEWIKTRNNDKNATSAVFLTFTISQAATVYVAYDSRATRLPSWLSNGFELTSMTIGVSEEMGHLNVYRKEFSAGTTVSLGGNMTSDGVDSSSNYIVIVKPTGSTEHGLVFSSDTTISFAVEDGGTGSQSINLTTSDSSTASYSISDDAPWLSVSPSRGSTPGNMNVTVGASGLSPGTYNATITAVASGYTNDTVIVSLEVTGSNNDPFEVNILKPTTYAVSDLDVGDRYYLDRTYTLTSIPTGLSTGKEEWIKTRNNDKNATSAVFLTFTISQAATVYVAYDSRATRLPSWLSNGFELTSMTIGISEEMGHFRVYQHDFPAGTVSIGGNMASGAEGASSNYIVVVKPTGSTEHGLVFSSDINVNNDWVPDESQNNLIKPVLPEDEQEKPIIEEEYSSYQDNLKSVLLEDGQRLTVESPEGTIISKLTIKEKPSSSSIPLDDLDFTYGLVDLTIENVDVNGSAIVTLYYPEDSSPEAYYKYGPTPDQPEDHWYEFMYDGETGAVIDQNIITLHYVDGKRGDDNVSVVDDKISDTVGGAVFRSSQAIQPEAATSSGESNNAEGCFLRCLNLQ
jgi:hypothetical protein